MSPLSCCLLCNKVTYVARTHNYVARFHERPPSEDLAQLSNPTNQGFLASPTVQHHPALLITPIGGRLYIIAPVIVRHIRLFLGTVHVEIPVFAFGMV